MTAISLALIVTGVLLNACAQALLKAGVNTIGHFEFSLANAWPVGTQLALQPHILGGLFCYVVSVGVWIMALSRVPVSVAYPMLSIGYVINAAVAALWLGEALSVSRMVGIGIIILGVLVVARS